MDIAKKVRSRIVNLCALGIAALLLAAAPLATNAANAAYLTQPVSGAITFQSVAVYNTPRWMAASPGNVAYGQINSWDVRQDIYMFSMGLRNTSNVQFARWQTPTAGDAQGTEKWFIFDNKQMPPGTFYLNASASKTHGAPHERIWYGHLQWNAS